MAAVSGQIYGNRLPRLRFVAESALEAAAVITFDVSERDGRVTLAFSGDLALAPLESDVRSVRWDFWKVLSTLLLRILLTRRIVTFHAACLQVRDRTWLIPGESGAGKSLLSFLARAHGGSVLASELSFVCDGALVAGNCVMCIDAGALTAHEIPLRGDEAALDGQVLSPTDVPRGRVPLTGVAFPKVMTAGPATDRGISGQRTQRLLYDNAVGQLACWQLLDDQGVPASLSTPTDELLHIAREATTVAGTGGVARGGPAARDLGMARRWPSAGRAEMNGRTAMGRRCGWRPRLRTSETPADIAVGHLAQAGGFLLGPDTLPVPCGPSRKVSRPNPDPPANLRQHEAGMVGAHARVKVVVIVQWSVLLVRHAVVVGDHACLGIHAEAAQLALAYLCPAFDIHDDAAQRAPALDQLNTRGCEPGHVPCDPSARPRLDAPGPFGTSTPG